MAMSNVVQFKAFLHHNGNRDVRRFYIEDTSVVTNFEYMKAKLQSVFPVLRNVPFTITWEDQDGDRITISTDEDLILAFTIMHPAGNTKVLQITTKPDNTSSTSPPSALYPNLCPVGLQSMFTGEAAQMTAAAAGSAAQAVAETAQQVFAAAMDAATTAADQTEEEEEDERQQEAEVPSPSNVTGTPQRHPHITCDGCSGAIVGRRYKCLECWDYDLCERCDANGVHDGHMMVRCASSDLFKRWGSMRVFENIKKIVRKESYHHGKREHRAAKHAFKEMHGGHGGHGGHHGKFRCNRNAADGNTGGHPSGRGSGSATAGACPVIDLHGLTRHFLSGLAGQNAPQATATGTATPTSAAQQPNTNTGTETGVSEDPMMVVGELVKKFLGGMMYGGDTTTTTTTSPATATQTPAAATQTPNTAQTPAATGAAQTAGNVPPASVPSTSVTSTPITVHSHSPSPFRDNPMEVDLTMQQQQQPQQPQQPQQQQQWPASTGMTIGGSVAAKQPAEPGWMFVSGSDSTPVLQAAATQPSHSGESTSAGQPVQAQPSAPPTVTTDPALIPIIRLLREMGFQQDEEFLVALLKRYDSSIAQVVKHLLEINH